MLTPTLQRLTTDGDIRRTEECRLKLGLGGRDGGETVAGELMSDKCHPLCH